MTRKYDIRLLEKLKEREGKGNYKGQELIIKRLPDCDEDGAMDPRLFEDQKKMMKMLKIMPMFMVKKMMKVDPEHIDNLREMFNGIKSVPVVTSEITTKKHEVETAKGITCDVYQYTNEKTTKESPVLYYIQWWIFWRTSWCCRRIFKTDGREIWFYDFFCRLSFGS